MRRWSGWSFILYLAAATLAQAQTATMTRVVTSGSPSFAGQLVTFTATVTAAQTTVPDGETVTFFDGTTQVGTGTTVVGVATFSIFTLSAKVHTITATYAGDVTFGSSSGTVKQVITAYTSATNVSADITPSTFGQPAQFSATVTSTGPEAPTGSVTFVDGSKVIGTGKISINGLTILRVSNLAAGTHFVTAKYSGDTNTSKSLSTAATQVVNSASTGVSVLSKPNASKKGQLVTLTAVVTSPANPATGTVAFMDGSTLLATANVVSGKATYATSALGSGLHQISAVYNDASNSSQSSSPPLAQIVVRPGGKASAGYYAFVIENGSFNICPYDDSWSGVWPPTGTGYFYDRTVVDAPAFFGNAYADEYFDPSLNANGLFTCRAGVLVFQLGVEYGHSHSSQSAYAADHDANDPFKGADSYSQASWYDQIYILGVPEGSPVQIQVSAQLLSSVDCTILGVLSGNGTVEYSPDLSDANGVLDPQLTFYNSCSNPSPFTQTGVQVITVAAGFAHPLSLESGLVVDMGSTPMYATIQVPDASLTIQPLTPGAVVWSMSGLSYAH
jgi:hypothetical protein